MKKLSDFKDEKAMSVVADLMEPIMDIVGNENNKNAAKSKDGIAMFKGFFKNSPRSMMDIFAVLSEIDPAEYHCDGVEVLQNIMQLASDEKMISLFTSQSQMGDATSSGDASENTGVQ